MTDKRKGVSDLVAETEAEERRDAREALRNKSTVRDLRSRVRALESELEDSLAANDILDGLQSVSGEVHKIPKLPGRKGKPSAVAIAMFSDWHVEERVRPETVHGWNEYTLEIAEARIHKATRGLIRLVKQSAREVDVRHLVVWIGGDLLSGDIHDDYEPQLSPLATILWLEPRVYALIKELRAKLQVDKLTVVWTHGNHGREGKKWRVGTNYKYNREWLLGQFLKERIEREQREGGWEGLTFVAEPVEVTYLDLGFMLRCHHGDAFKFQGGIGGFTVGLNKAILGMNQSPLDADLDILGHWHNRWVTPTAMVNGSLIGWNVYGEKVVKAKFEPPVQSYGVWNLERGMLTEAKPIFCTAGDGAVV